MTGKVIQGSFLGGGQPKLPSPVGRNPHRHHRLHMEMSDAEIGLKALLGQLPRPF
jgi:hypothetical protein